EGVPDLLV
nr:Chain C, Envelope small membrane protein [Severe acute respiratory syndrome-related coronavirus]7NTJ_G Chain G, Envelope small membrane protein [Severe acute respiratory syndrome-related coronavirus]